MISIVNSLIEHWFFSLFLVSILILYFIVNNNVKRYSEIREFNKTESPIEEFLFEEIRSRKDHRNLQYEVYAQVPCGPYRIDLAIYSKRGKIAIEADGKDHHSSKEQIKHDMKKDKYLKSKGWKVYRFSGSDIYRNKKGCVDEIEESIYKKSFFSKKTTHLR